MHTCVFLGPTLPRERAISLLPASYCPPIRRGDLERVRTCGLRRVLIVDGVFYSHRSVSLTEIRDALRAGIEIWGTASMGALRAVEAEPLGMRGIGQVFEKYRTGQIVDDDEVALIFADGSWAALSEPLICMREALSYACVQGWLSSSESERALAILKKAHFSYRTFRLAFSELDNECANILTARLNHCRYVWDIKMNDAIEALQYLRSHPAKQEEFP